MLINMMYIFDFKKPYCAIWGILHVNGFIFYDFCEFDSGMIIIKEFFCALATFRLYQPGMLAFAWGEP